MAPARATQRPVDEAFYGHADEHGEHDTEQAGRPEGKVALSQNVNAMYAPRVYVRL